MSSITANLSSAQRRLMNVLYDTGKSCPGMTADRARDAASVDHNEVIGLAMADLVEARTAGRGELIDVVSASATGVLFARRVILRLTNLGISWCRENPRNALLRALDTAPRGKFTIAVAKEVVDDRGEICALASYGFASLHYAGDLRETKFSEDDGAYEYRHAKDFVLIATPKIRTVLGPKA